MLLPIRCFTCNKLLADEKLNFFEKHRNKKYEDVKKIFITYVDAALEKIGEKKASDGSVEHELVIYPSELKDEFKYQPGKEEHFTVSPTTDFLLLNMLGVDLVCCRRMFLGYVDLIDKIN